MPNFNYRARDKAGALVTGALEAGDLLELETALDKMGLIPIKVEAGRGAAFSLKKLNRYFEKVRQEDIIIFSRQLSTLFGAGVPLTRALFSLETQSTNPSFSAVIKTVREEVEGGSSLSAALKRHPKVFPELYSNMVSAGEAGGILDSVLDRLASMLEKNAENRAKVRSATLYPKIVVVAIVAAVAVLMNFVVPKFAALYSSFQVDLPIPTRILIRASEAFTAWWYIFLGLAIAAWLALRRYARTEAGRLRLDSLALKAPVFGPLILKSILSRFARIFSSLYRSGLPILQSLDIVSRAVDNRVIEAEIKAIEDEVRAGRGLTEPMAASPHFPQMVVQMVAVGEDTGKLDEMLDKTADYYDREVDTTIKNLTTTLEPILLGVIFAVVMFLALSIFLPMWDILKLVRR